MLMQTFAQHRIDLAALRQAGHGREHGILSTMLACDMSSTFGVHSVQVTVCLAVRLERN